MTHDAAQRLIRKTFYGGEGYDSVKLGKDDNTTSAGLVIRFIGHAVMMPVYSMAQILKK